MNINYRPKLIASKIETMPTGRHHDGNGLMLNVKPSGSRQWLQRIVIQGKRVDIGLGGYPCTGLAKARKKAFENRQIARDGGDPRVKRSKAPTFAEAARTVHGIHAPAIKNATDRAKWMAELVNHVFPLIGDRPVDQITTDDVLKIILPPHNPMWHVKPTTAKRVQRRLYIILQWAIAKGYRTDNPAGDALKAVLPRQTHKPEHMKAVPYKEVGNAIRKVRKYGKHEYAKLALEFLVLTAVRSNEVRNAKWSDINLNEQIWTIPGDRMKAKQEHRVPLSDRAIEILEQARETLTGTANEKSGLVFPNRGKVFDEKIMRRMMQDLEIKTEEGEIAHPHGFRTSFKDWSSEMTDVPDEVSEHALAHSVGSSVRQAYARSDLFAKRVKLMQDWADYLKK